MHSTQKAGLLVLPGWGDYGRYQFEALKARLQGRGWICHRADLPDSSWPVERRASVSRETALRQALQDYYALQCAVNGGPIAVAGFSFGAYIAAYVAAARPVGHLILRSPAIYADDGWEIPKEQLDRGDLTHYRELHLTASQNRVLACCARFAGNVLLVESGCDQVLPRAVAASYAAAFTRARSLTRHTLLDADHELTNPAWQDAYRCRVVGWLTDMQADLPGWPRDKLPLRQAGSAMR